MTRLSAITLGLISVVGVASQEASATPEAAAAVAKLIDEVCVSSASSEAIVTSAEKLVSEHGWKLIAAKVTPLPMMQNEKGPEISYTIAVEGRQTDAISLTLVASILRPENSGMKYNICFVEPSIQIEETDIRRAIDDRFSTRFERTIFERKADYDEWLVSTEKASGRCERKLGVQHWQMSSRGKSRTTSFMHIALPRGDTSPLAGFLNCKV